MSFSSTAVSHTHTYRDSSEIHFSPSDGSGLSVTIDTKRLHMRSVQLTDFDNYIALFGDEEIMEKFATGKPRTEKEIRVLINDVWVKRWKESNPYSGLAVFEKETNAFMGHVGLSDTHMPPGELDLGGIGHKQFWGNKYASEAIVAIVREYIPATIQEGYTLKGTPLKKITATARPDNEASIRLLQGIGMHFVRKEEKFGAMRNHYAIDVSELCKKSSKKVSE